MNVQRVDPFIPIATPKRVSRAYPGLVNNVPRSHAADPQRRTLDAIQHRPPRIMPPEPRHTAAAVRPQVRVNHATAPNPVQAQAPQIKQTAKAKRRPKHRILRSLRTPALAILVMIAGMLIQAAAFGEILIAIYAIFALWKRIPSRTSFLLALLSLVGVVVLLLIKTNDSLAATFTIYTFLLLGTGVLSILKEMRAENA